MDKKANRKDDKPNIKRSLLIGAVSTLGVLILASIIILIVSLNVPYVAKVGGEKITKGEYNIFLNDEKRYMLSAVKDAEMDAETFWNTEIEGVTAIELAKRNALESAREFKIQVIEAKKAGIKLTGDEISYVNMLVETQMVPPGYTSIGKRDEYFQQMIGATYNELVGVQQQLVLIQKLIADFADKMQVEEQVLKAYFEENTSSFREVSVQHILVSADEDMTEEEKNAAYAKAQEILEKVQAGGDYTALAEEYENADGNTDYNFTAQDGYVDEFKNWAFDNTEGATGIVETEFGYHVMKHNGFRETFDELKDKVKLEYSQSMYDEKVEEWKKLPQYNAERNEKVYNSIK